MEDQILEIRGQKVLLDYEVATLYGVETKRINEAVKNNPDKFPSDYLFTLSRAEFDDLRSKVSTASLNFAMLKFKHTVKKKRNSQKP